MATAAAVARHLTRLAADPEGEPMTPARLHKLLYYCQGWYLAWYARPLFAERIEAQRYGPVVPELDDATVAVTPLTAAEAAAVEQVWGEYGRYSAAGLREKTQRERPWVEHASPDGRCGIEIPQAELLAFFGERHTRETGELVGCMAEFEANVAEGRLISHEQLLEGLGR